MAKRKFQLTEDDVDNSRSRARDSGISDSPMLTSIANMVLHVPVLLRRIYDYQAVRLYGTGYPVEEVREITGASRTSLMEWCQKYLAEGTKGLMDQRVGGNRARLTPMQIEDLKSRLHTYTPAQVFGKTTAMANGQFWTVQDLKRGIEQWYGVSYQSTSSYHRYFDPPEADEFSYQRPQKVYKSRSEAKVAEFEAELEKKIG